MSFAPTHEIVETSSYSAQLRKLGVTLSECGAINDQYASNPDYGVILKRTGGLRKGRVGSDATGKSGGYRVFSFYASVENPVYLLGIIDKTKDTTLTAQQEIAFRRLTVELKQECR